MPWSVALLTLTSMWMRSPSRAAGVANWVAIRTAVVGSDAGTLLLHSITAEYREAIDLVCLQVHG
jgi:hypothetical protein